MTFDFDVFEKRQLMLVTLATLFKIKKAERIFKIENYHTVESTLRVGSS